MDRSPTTQRLAHSPLGSVMVRAVRRAMRRDLERLERADREQSERLARLEAALNERIAALEAAQSGAGRKAK